MSTPSLSSAPLSLDPIFEHYIGSSGKWQRRQFACIVVQTLASSAPLFVHLFSAFVPRHRCLVAGCDEERSAFDAPFLAFAIPEAQSGDGLLREGERYERCRMFLSINASSCLPESFDHNVLVHCSSIKYDQSIFETTFATTQGLVCGSERWSQMLGTMLMLGMLLGSLLGGPMGDKLGRRSSILSASVGLCVSLLSGALAAHSYALYAFTRLVSCVCVLVLWLNSCTLTLEVFGPQHRFAMYLILFMSYSVGMAMLPWVAFVERHWQRLHLCLGLFVGLTVPMTWGLLSESLRWMVLNDRLQDALKTVRQVIHTNDRSISESDFDAIEQLMYRMAIQSRRQLERQLSPVDMCKHGYFKQTLVLFGAWATSIVSTYMLAFNSINLPGNVFLNVSITCLMDVPSNLFLFFGVDLIGRRRCLMGVLLALSAECLLIASVPKNLTLCVLLLFMLGKFTSSVGVTLSWLYTSELFPTNLRAQSLGTLSSMARILGALSPFLSNLGHFWPPLPMIMLAIPAFISGCMCVFLDETKGQRLPDFKEENRPEEIASFNQNNRNKENECTDIPNT